MGLLIGQDNPEALIPLEVRKGRKNDPYAVRTMLGSCINGPVNAGWRKSDPTIVPRRQVIAHFISTETMEDQVNKLWAIENEDLTGPLVISPEDEHVIALWDANIDLSNGHYVLPIPWKKDCAMPNNFEMAMSHLKSLKSSLERRGLYQKYDEEIQKMLSKGYSERVDEMKMLSNAGTCLII